MKLLLFVTAIVGQVCAQVAGTQHSHMGKGRGAPHTDKEGAPKPKEDPLKARQDAWLDWHSSHISAIADDTYATGLNPWWYGYPNAIDPTAPQSDREKLGWATVSKSYQITAQGIENQIGRLYHADEFDHDSYTSLNYQLDAANYNALAGALEFVDVGFGGNVAPWAWWLGYYYPAQDALLGYDLALENEKSTHHDIDKAWRTYQAAEYWNQGAFFYWLQGAGVLNDSPNIGGILTLMGTMQDDYNAHDDLYHAERAYWDDPNAETHHALDIAEISKHATSSGVLWGLTGVTDQFNNYFSGYFSPAALFNQYHLAARASEHEEDFSAYKYHKKYGNYPEDDFYFPDDHHYYYYY